MRRRTGRDSGVARESRDPQVTRLAEVCLPQAIRGRMARAASLVVGDAHQHHRSRLVQLGRLRSVGVSDGCRLSFSERPSEGTVVFFDGGTPLGTAR